MGKGSGKCASCEAVSAAVFAALCLFGCHPAKAGRVVGQIPPDERETGAFDLLHRGKAMAFPKGWPTPQAIEFFDFAIALGLGDWQEDQFDAQKQTQAHELSENARVFVAATKRGIVVELQKLRDS